MVDSTDRERLADETVDSKECELVVWRVDEKAFLSAGLMVDVMDGCMVGKMVNMSVEKMGTWRGLQTVTYWGRKRGPGSVRL